MEQDNISVGGVDNEVHNNHLLLWLILGIILVVIVIIIIFFSISSKNISACPKDAAKYIDCITNLAVEKNDTSICSQLKDTGAGIKCLGSVNKNSEFCNKYSDSTQKQLCLWGVAESSNNVNLCKSLPIYQRCLPKIALQTINTSICMYFNDISDGRLNDQTSKDTAIDYCLSPIAISTGNLAICNQIISPYNRNDCILGVANKTLDDSLCALLNVSVSLSSQDVCNYNLAIAKNDENICNKTIDTLGDSTRDLCYGKIAQEKVDANICYNIKELGGGRPRCFIGLVSVTGNKSYCDMISDAEWKDFCIYGPRTDEQKRNAGQ